MKHIICRRSLLLFSAMALSLSVTSPRAVLAEESSPYGDIDGDPVVSEIALIAKELNPPEASENGGILPASRLQTVRVIVELREPCVLEAGLDPASAPGRAYAQKLIANQSADVQSIRQAMGAGSIMKKEAETDTSFMQFTNVMNGFVMDVPKAMIPKIKKMENVKRVFEDVIHPIEDTVISEEINETLNSFSPPGSYDTDYTGEGLLIGIIDTGLDLYHPAFAKEPENGRIAEDTVFEGLHASDPYKSAKVPFAYDYADDDPDVIPSGADGISSHGTHIAGIIAGNDDVIQGVLPDAQLAFFKIRPDDSDGVSDSGVIMALEDIVIVKPDAINLSFGEPGGDDGSHEFWDFESENLAMNEIYDRVYDAGVMISAACGNNGSMGRGNPGAGNSVPHMGNVDAPSTYEAALAVGSVHAEVFGRYYFRIYGSSTDHPYMDPCYGEENCFEALFEEGALEYADCGLGRSEDFENAGIEGRLALVQYGEISVGEKQKNAAEAGAVGVIVYNNTKGSFPSLNTDHSSIPCIGISKYDGEDLLAADLKYITTVYEGEMYDDVYAEVISEYSSLGTTDDLRIKPEILAPGDYVFSSVVGGYDTYSGTSMAAPHAAAALSAAKAYAREHELGQSERELADAAIRLLMSTASPAEKNGKVTSVRQAGAGILNLSKALSAHAYLSVETAEGKRPKIECGDDPEKSGSYPMNFSVTNISASSMKYNIDTLCFTAYTDRYREVYTIPLDHEVSGDTSVTAGPGETVSVSLSIQLSGEGRETLEKNFECGGFVEGYILLNPDEESDDAVQLSLPYVAYYGDWDEHPLLDVTLEDGSKAEAGITAAVAYGPYADMLENSGNYYCPVIGMNPFDDTLQSSSSYYRDVPAEYALISSLINPAFDEYDDAIKVLDRTKNAGVYSAALGLFKSVGRYAIRIHSADTDEVYFETAGEGFFRKPGVQTGGDFWADFPVGWAATDASGKPLEDGTNVIMEVSVSADEGEHWDSKTIPLTIDNRKPYIVGSTPSEDDSEINSFSGVRLAVTAGGKKYLKFEAADDNYVAYVQLGSSIETIEYHPAEETGDESLAALTYTGLKVVTDQNRDPADYTRSFMPAEKGEAGSVALDVSDFEEDRWYVCVGDYAGLKTYYEITAETTVPFTIQIDPAETTVLVGSSIVFVDFKVFDLDGAEMNPASLTWKISGNESPMTMFMGSLQKLMIAPDESAETLTITATDPADPSVTASAAIHLVHESDLKLQINPQSALIAAGDTLQLAADVQPEAAKNLPLTWKSSDESIASVDANGQISTLKAGKAVITASIGKVSAESEVTVLFKDVADPESYYFDAVYWALENDITTGTGPDLFSPKNTVTRAQTVTFLYRMAGEPEVSSQSTFVDVDPDKYYADAVSWALENGITTGYTDGSGKFGPNDKCTREQFVTFLWRYAGKPAPSETKMFTDEKEGAYYVDAISWAAEKNITTGLNDGTGRFGIGKSCNRAMAVTFLSRFAQTNQ